MRNLLSLVVPTYNERENIVTLLDRVRGAGRGRPLEVWVVDDDSPDRTWRVVAEYGERHPEVHLIPSGGGARPSSKACATCGATCWR